ncbi:MAG: polyprenyl synthetase family protein [Synergistaceae bacterium]|nr:polyprenyl synthetase family protein [Synergistaceae bacterium]
MDFQQVMAEFKAYADYVDQYIEKTAETRANRVPEKLFESMEYSLTAGGKRLRPVLCLAAAEACGCTKETAMPMALGYEMTHTASLIHDDLPCMDNDDMRRGKLSNHAKFGETLAVLAGDALMVESIAYPLAYTSGVSSDRLLNAVRIFTEAFGPSGVCGGQVLDMDCALAEKEPDYVCKVAALKTGELIKAALMSGAALGTDDGKTLLIFEKYGKHLGTAFQIIDDILDVTTTSEQLGKTPGKDAEQGKINYVTAYGLEKAKEFAKEESEAAKAVISELLGEESFLAQLPMALLERTK